MKKKNKIWIFPLIALGLVLMLTNSCKKDDTKAATSTVTDADGNVYSTVTIGTQTWMKENLKTTRYRNGTIINNITDGLAWTTQTAGAYCWYNDYISNKDSYGALYNFYTVEDSRNLCPIGWHIPTDKEWKTFEMYLGMTQAQADATGERGTDQGSKMKSTLGWYISLTPPYHDGNGINSSGFSALPGGNRGRSDGSFGNMRYSGHWWSSSGFDVSDAWDRTLFHADDNVGRFNRNKQFGFSVRCLKD